MIYGFTLRRPGRQGVVLSYVGVELQDVRPEEYLPALLLELEGGGPRHEVWRKVPGRLRHAYEQNGYRSRQDLRVVEWMGPKYLETGLTLAMEAVLGRDASFGGVLALNPAVEVVQDACTLLRLHDQGRCVACGAAGHRAGSAQCQVNALAGFKALPRISW